MHGPGIGQVWASNWFVHNKLSKKSKLMVFETRSQAGKCINVKVRHGPSELKRVNKFKYLGIKLDLQLSFSDHVQYIRGKVVPKKITRTRELIFEDWSEAETSFIAGGRSGPAERR